MKSVAPLRLFSSLKGANRMIQLNPHPGNQLGNPRGASLGVFLVKKFSVLGNYLVAFLFFCEFRLASVSRP